MMEHGTVIFHETNYNNFFHTWNGPVGRDLTRRARGVEYKAIGSAGLRTGDLRRAIGTHFGRHGVELEARVGANPAPGGKVGYGLFHHEGTGPHTIRPRQARALRFVMQGRVVFAASVNHPGTRPNPYLTRWLREAVQ